MTIAGLLKAAVDLPGTRIQLTTETLVGAQACRAKKGFPAHTRLTFVTQVISPNDLLEREPSMIGYIVWVPREDYKRLTDA